MQVTRLRELAGGQVAVELDGVPWRTLPASVVVGAGLRAGLDLDRGGFRALRRELRRAEAVDAAARLLGRRDLSRFELRTRLERQGLAPAAVKQGLDRLASIGVLEDLDVAQRRAAELSERGYGDAAIAADLERRGIDSESIDEALAALEPEDERACATVAARGATLATARRLVRRGFHEDSLAVALPELVAKGRPDR